MGQRTPVRFGLLADFPGLIPQVATWWCSEWGLPERHSSFTDYVDELAGSCSPDGFPVHLLALSENEAVGVATLKEGNALASIFPDSRCWLSGVYVPPAARGRGIATALCLKIVELAASREISRLHLQTEALDGGLYAKVGWVPVRRLRLDGLEVLVMARNLPG